MFGIAIITILIYIIFMGFSGFSEGNAAAPWMESESRARREGWKRTLEGELMFKKGGNQNQDRNKGESSWNRVPTSPEINKVKWELIAKENQGWKMRKSNGQS